MVFSSLVFLTVFLPATILLYYAIPSIWWKNCLLVVCSLIFYAWGEPKYVFLMFASIVVNYSFGLLIHRSRRIGLRKGLLTLAVLFNLGLLLYFKYFGFLGKILTLILAREVTLREVALPIGISFFTFQGLSYVIDVFREKPESPETWVVQQNFIDLALYISMFPQLIAGPIVRYHDIQPYLRGRKHSASQFARGVELFIWGLSKKVLIANLLGQTVDLILIENVDMIDAPIAWLGAICYSLQLFFDFAGYSQMAIGLGKMFGFEFQENFNYPYISTSITEFWRRWHISLSQWFRDYLYIPLGGSRKGNVYVNLFIVFLATGLWHGAAFGFLVWGLWHGFFILAERFFKRHPLKKLRMPHAVGWLYTMLVAVLGWCLFRIVSLRDSLHFFSVLFGLSKPGFVRFNLAWYLDLRTLTVLIIGILLCVPWKALLSRKLPRLSAAAEGTAALIGRRIVAIGLLALCFLFISNSTYNPFIYFRF